jgi:DNA-binding response OmpR family regulator
MHILCVSDDALLALTRSAVLRFAGHTVVDSTSVGAWRAFKRGDFDAVVFCPSVPDCDQVELTRQMSARSPSLVIVRYDEDRRGDAANVVHISRFDPQAIIAAVNRPAHPYVSQ